MRRLSISTPSGRNHCENIFFHNSASQRGKITSQMNFVKIKIIGRLYNICTILKIILSIFDNKDGNNDDDDEDIALG